MYMWHALFLDFFEHHHNRQYGAGASRGHVQVFQHRTLVDFPAERGHQLPGTCVCEHLSESYIQPCFGSP